MSHTLAGSGSARMPPRLTRASSTSGHSTICDRSGVAACVARSNDSAFDTNQSADEGCHHGKTRLGNNQLGVPFSFAATDYRQTRECTDSRYCDCIPLSCSNLSSYRNCGNMSDRCGGSLDCGSCGNASRTRRRSASAAMRVRPAYWQSAHPGHATAAKKPNAEDDSYCYHRCSYCYRQLLEQWPGHVSLPKHEPYCL
jgi:hypothetical protein